MNAFVYQEMKHTFSQLSSHHHLLLYAYFPGHCLIYILTFSLLDLQKLLWTPSKVIARLGKEINNENSYLYWAYKVCFYEFKQNIAIPNLT